MSTRPKHQSRSIECHLGVPRSEAWPAVEALVDALQPSVRLSVEAPWRLVFERDTVDTALSFWEGTLLLRDDGDECHVAFSLVFDPDPSDAGMVEVERTMREMAGRLATLPGAESETDERFA